MIKVNKILLTFFGVVFILVFALFQFIETKAFTNYLLNPILKKLAHPFGIQVWVGQIDLQFFPPATYFKNVEVEKAGTFALALDRIGAVYSISNVIKNDYNLNNLKIHGGVLRIEKNERSKLPWKWEDIKKLSDLHDDIVRSWVKFKLGQIEISKFLIQGTNEAAFVESAQLGFSDKEFAVRLDVLDVRSDENQLDGIQANVTLTKDNLSIHSLKIENEFNYVEFNGVINLHEKLVSGQVSLSGVLSILPEYFPHLDKIHELKGNIKTSFSFMASSKDLSISNGDAELRDVEFQNRTFRKVTLGFALIDKIISVKKMMVQDNFGQLNINDEIKVFDLDKKKLVAFDTSFTGHNFNLNSVLPLLVPSLDVISTYLDLEGRIGIDGDGAISVQVSHSSRARNFILKGKKGGDILAVPDFNINNLIVTVSKDSILQFGYDLRFNSGNISGTGTINDKSLDFNAVTTDFDLVDFGPISAVPLFGKANLKINITGPLEKTVMTFKGKAEDFGVVGLKLGQLDLDLKLDLDEPKLRINNAFGKYKATVFDGSGVLNFTNFDGPNLKINLKDGRIEDVIEMCFEEMSFSKKLKSIVRGNIHGTVGIAGSFSAKGLHVFGDMTFPRAYIYEEGFEKGRASFNYEMKSLNVKQLILKKGHGQLALSFLFDTNTNYMEYDASLGGVMLDDLYYYRFLNLGLQGKITADLFGSGTLEDLSTKNVLTISESRIKGRYLKDTVIKIYNNGPDVFINTMLGGGLAKLDGYVNFLGGTVKNSHYNFNVKTDDIKNIMGLISVHNIDNKELDGEIDLEGKGTFNIKDIASMDLELAVNNFFLRNNKVKLLNSERGLVQIVSGNIKSWSLSFEGDQYYLKSHAIGSLRAGFKITQAFNLPFQLIEMLTPKISSAKGSVKGLSIVKLVDTKFLYSFDLAGTDLGIRTIYSPLAIDDGKFSINVSGNEILIEKFQSSLGKGRLSGNGKIKINFPYPEIQIDLDFDKTLIPLFKQSSLVFSGNSRVYGLSPPYKFSANIYLVRGEIKDDLNYIRENLNMGGKSYKNAPIDRTGHQPFVDYNVNFNFDSPLVLRNQLMEFYVLGASNLWGNEFSMNIQSKIEIVPGMSKLFFKGHEFVINKGLIEFDKINGVRNPMINIRGGTRISGYNILFDGSGFLDNLTVNFRSEPVLAQEDILSLLTIGVTSQVSKNLQSSDLEAVTSLSLGSILLDQFGISENLNRSVGVKLSVLPELAQDDINPMQGRAGIADPGSSKMKSATKIKIQKKVKEFDLSFSSTFGGTLQQKQEMNINYNLRPDVSVQGVYEMYSTDSTNNRTSPDSAGVDLIWKKTFK